MPRGERKGRYDALGSFDIPPEGRILRQRGDSRFLVQIGDNTARIVEVATGVVSTVPDLKSELASGSWEDPSDPGGAEKAVFLVKVSEVRWRKKDRVMAGIDFSGDSGTDDGNE